MGYSFTSRYKRTWIRKFICVDCGQGFQVVQKGIVPPLALKDKNRVAVQNVPKNAGAAKEGATAGIISEVSHRR